MRSELRFFLQEEEQQHPDEQPAVEVKIRLLEDVRDVDREVAIPIDIAPWSVIRMVHVEKIRRSQNAIVLQAFGQVLRGHP